MTDLDRALKDALVLGLENDATAEHILQIAAPFIDRALQDQNNRIEKLEAALIDILKVPRSEASWGIALVIAHHALKEKKDD